MERLLKDTQLLKKQRDKVEREKKEIHKLFSEENAKTLELQAVLQRLLERDTAAPNLSKDEVKKLLHKPENSPQILRDTEPSEVKVPFANDKQMMNRTGSSSPGNANNEPISLDPNQMMTFEEFCRQWDKTQHEDPYRVLLLSKVHSFFRSR